MLSLIATPMSTIISDYKYTAPPMEGESSARWSWVVHRISVSAIVLLPVALNVGGLCRHGVAIRQTDEHFYHAYARSWYFDHDCQYENDLRMAPGFDLEHLYVGSDAPFGDVPYSLFCGTSIVSMPLLAVGDAMTMGHNLVSHRPLPRDGYNAYYQIAVSLGHTAIGVIGLLACYVLCRRYFPGVFASIAVLCTWLGTSALYYVGYESTQSHASSFAAVALMLWVTDHIHRNGFSAKRMIALGLLGGMMVAIRPQNLIWAVVPITVIVIRLLHLKRDGIRAYQAMAWLLATTLLGAACYIPQAIVHYSHFGRLVENGYRHILADGEPAVMQWSAPNFARAVVHPVNGLLWTTPFVLIAALGLFALARRRNAVIRSLVVAFVLMYALVACIWWDPVGFGHRYFISSIPVLALSFCAVLSWACVNVRRKVLLATLVSVLLGWNIHGFSQVASGARSVRDANTLSEWFIPPA